MPKIEEDFNRAPNKALSMQQFIKIMLHHLPQKDADVETGLVRNLIELFRQIDVNNDQSLEYDEFTKHIIELGKWTNSPVTHLGLVSQDQNNVDSEKKYFPSKIEDNEKHDTEIENMYFVEKFKHLLVIERDCSMFKVYNSRTMKYIKSVPEPKKASNGLWNSGSNSFDDNGGAIIAADFVDIPGKNPINYVATTSNKPLIQFWDPTNDAYTPRD
jgi:hypothetical protein